MAKIWRNEERHQPAEIMAKKISGIGGEIMAAIMAMSAERKLETRRNRNQ
jgi:hypothetical protein